MVSIYTTTSLCALLRSQIAISRRRSGKVLIGGVNPFSIYSRSSKWLNTLIRTATPVRPGGIPPGRGEPAMLAIPGMVCDGERLVVLSRGDCSTELLA